jgi:hypothetical protein
MVLTITCCILVLLGFRKSYEEALRRKDVKAIVITGTPTRSLLIYYYMQYIFSMAVLELLV